MNDADITLVRPEVPKETHYLYALADSREPEDIPKSLWVSRQQANLGWIGAYQGSLSTALYRRYENFKRQLSLFTCSPSNQWLRNCLNSKAFPQVKLLYVAEQVAKHTLHELLKRIDQGYYAAGIDAVNGRYIRLPTEAEVIAAVAPAQRYSDDFFSKLWHARELNPELCELRMTALPRKRTPAHRPTIAGLAAELALVRAELALCASKAEHKKLDATVTQFSEAAKALWNQVQALEESLNRLNAPTIHQSESANT